MSAIPSIVIGTALLWGTIFLLVNPTARFLARRRLKNQNLIDPRVNPKIDDNQIPARYFMFSGALIFTIIGLIIGIATGTFFIGFSWSKRHLPGVITLITASIAGSIVQFANFGIMIPLLIASVLILLGTGLSVTSQSATAIKLNNPSPTTKPYTSLPNATFQVEANNQQAIDNQHKHSIQMENPNPWQQKFCGYCGTPLKEKGEFCGNCGKKIKY